MIMRQLKIVRLHTVPLNWFDSSATDELHPWAQSIILGDLMIESLSVIFRNGEEHKNCQKAEDAQMFPFSKHTKNRFQKQNANKHDIESWQNYRTDEAYSLSTSFQVITRR